MPDKYEASKLFNRYLKGKYAYWIQMHYIVPFDLMRHEGYVACEEDITKLLKKANGTYPKPYGCPYIDMYSENGCIMPYIDMIETDNINNISKFILENEKAPDFDITIDDLKNFRTWLASTILSIDSIKDEIDGNRLSDIEKKMLEYYSNGMMNNTVKELIMFSGVTVSPIMSDGCGCCNSSISLSNNINSCDLVKTYKEYIYNEMIKVFGNLNFWLNFDMDFIKKFKSRIDNIIKVGLKVNNSDQILSIYRDCLCGESNDNNLILNKLSISLGYIIEGSHKAHYNFINDSLESWARHLYEYMQW